MKNTEHSEEILVQVQSAVAPLATIIHEVKDILHIHAQQESERISKIEESHNRHLEIYANNGYESKRVADNLSKMMEHSNIRDGKVDEMYQKFNDDRIIATADKKRIKDMVLYGSGVTAFMGIIVFAKWLIR